VMCACVMCVCVMYVCVPVTENTKSMCVFLRKRMYNRWEEEEKNRMSRTQTVFVCSFERECTTDGRGEKKRECRERKLYACVPARENVQQMEERKQKEKKRMSRTQTVCVCSCERECTTDGRKKKKRECRERKMYACVPGRENVE